MKSFKDYICETYIENPYFKYQDTNQENVIHSGWKSGNNFRFILEGCGDIFRELTKSYIDWGYISQKYRRAKEHIELEQRKIHPDDSRKTSLMHNSDKFAKMQSQWKKQPYETELQKMAIDMNINMILGCFSEAENLLDKIMEHQNDENI